MSTALRTWSNAIVLFISQLKSPKPKFYFKRGLEKSILTYVLYIDPKAHMGQSLPERKQTWH